jgi:uncharacterized protein YdeI (YjbR/CyaY-like superfamily)
VADQTDPVRFGTKTEFRDWLEQHQNTSAGIWLLLAKKDAGHTTVTYAEALDVALEFGWIDGQAKGVDELSHQRRFTPRRPQSPWSQRNREFAQTMIAEGRMAPRGLAEVERAQADGRWERAYAAQSNAEPHPDFLAALEANQNAKAFYGTLNSQNRYAIYYRIHSVKRVETRNKRIEAIVEMLSNGETFH